MDDKTTSAKDDFYDWDDDEEVFETMDDTPMKIQQGLFIGSVFSEQNLPALRQLGITHVLQVGEGLTPSHTEEFQYLQIHIQDFPHEDLVVHFPQCFQFMDEAISKNGGVLVHCVAGVSRSSTVCIGYIMWKEQLDYETAHRRVHSVRPWICPNEGFRKQLQEFQKIEYDVSKWKAWRHTWKEQPLIVRL